MFSLWTDRTVIILKKSLKEKAVLEVITSKSWSIRLERRKELSALTCQRAANFKVELSKFSMLTVCLQVVIGDKVNLTLMGTNLPHISKICLLLTDLHQTSQRTGFTSSELKYRRWYIFLKVREGKVPLNLRMCNLYRMPSISSSKSVRRHLVSLPSPNKINPGSIFPTKILNDKMVVTLKGGIEIRCSIWLVGLQFLKSHFYVSSEMAAEKNLFMVELKWSWQLILSLSFTAGELNEFMPSKLLLLTK